MVIYSLYRGTYLGSCITKVCRKCKHYEHYGYWSHGKKKHFTNESLLLEFLLSTEDTAFEFSLLQQYAHLLVLGALPFSTFAASYNRLFNYHNVDPEVCEVHLQALVKKKLHAIFSKKMSCTSDCHTIKFLKTRNHPPLPSNVKW